MKLAAVSAVLLAGLMGVAAALHAEAQQTVTAAAVWYPSTRFLAGFHARCDGRRGAAFDACFAAEMAKAGASNAALEFTNRLGNQAYLQGLDPSGGPIAIAHVFYPFRANENEAWLLVNGSPPLIDVDDWRKLSLAQMRSSSAYAEIRHQYPNVTFWPGERGSSGPDVEQGGREIIVGYLLRDLCHVCAIVGRVRYAFGFAADGKFLGARLVSVTPAER